VKRFYFEKLVRDKVVDDCLKDEKVLRTEWRQLGNDEYIRELVKKSIEEAEEIPLDSNDRAIALEEIADFQTVIDALRIAMGFSEQEVQEAKDRKATKKGDFTARRYIEYVDLADNSEWIAYFRAQPEKYREEEI
jgi:predicted house-cleaning noncanonical NTP pyrophosphatase (MazG superfamily)